MKHSYVVWEIEYMTCSVVSVNSVKKTQTLHWCVASFQSNSMCLACGKGSRQCTEISLSATGATLIVFMSLPKGMAGKKAALKWEERGVLVFTSFLLCHILQPLWSFRAWKSSQGFLDYGEWLRLWIWRHERENNLNNSLWNELIFD